MIIKSTFQLDRFVIRLIILSGITLSLIQFFSGRSILRDEAVLALSIINRSSLELFNPLDDKQVASMIFLQMEKLFSILLPHTDLGLRLFPLLCFFLALYFFYRLLTLLFSNTRTIIFALSIFVFNAFILRYATEVKQYMCDVLAISAIFYFLVKNYRNEKSKFIVLGLAGVISIFLTSVAPIILFSAGFYLLLTQFSGGKNNLKLVILQVVPWGIAFTFYYFLFIHNNENIANQVKSFSRVDGFVSINPFSTEFYHYLRLLINFDYKKVLPFGTISLVVLGVFIVAGIIALSKQKRFDLLFLTLLPVIMHLILSELKIYPIKPRLILYHVPLLIIIISFGYNQLMKLTSKNSKSAVYKGIKWVLPILLIFSMFMFNEFPWKGPEIKRSIEFIQERIKPNEKLFIHAAARKSFYYYKKIGFVKFTNREKYGKTWDLRDEQAFSELQILRRKTWILFIDKTNKYQEIITKKLENAGYEKIEEFVGNETSVYLVNFGNDKN
jgi:hypothetical protein